METMPHSGSTTIIYRSLAVMLISAGLAGCGDHSVDDTPAPVAVDDSIRSSTLVSGDFESDGSAGGQLSFSTREDEALEGLLAYPNATTLSDVSIASLPEHGELSLLPAAGGFRYEPSADYFGTDQFVYITAGNATITVLIDVAAEPDAPVIQELRPLVAEQGKRYIGLLQVTDPDSSKLQYDTRGLPDWLTVDPRTGTVSGIPGKSDVGMSEPFNLSVTDDTGLFDTLEGVRLQVVDTNTPPSLNVAEVPRKLYGGESISFNVFPDDVDRDAVSVFVEPHSGFDATVEDGLVSLEIRDINLARDSEIVIVALDERGAVTREVVPVFLYPRTASGKGVTISGAREGRGVNIVILGDGYTEDQRRNFEFHVDGVVSAISDDEGIADHLGAFNIHMIFTPSRDSGADDSDEIDSVDPVFDSAYNCRSVPRLICANTLELYKTALAEYPGTDQFILLVNDIRFGGSGSSGGRVAITSALHPELALHEMGHSLANLADEYIDPYIIDYGSAADFIEGEYKNVSRFDDPLRVPWSHWIDFSSPLPRLPGEQGVGVFEGGFYRSRNIFRATSTSRMRDYNEAFGPVNTEQWILRLYTLTSGYRSLTPDVAALRAVAGENLVFSVEPIFGRHVQEPVWSLNGELLTVSDADENTTNVSDSPGTAGSGNASPVVNVRLEGGGAIQALTNTDFTSIDLVLPVGQHQLDLTLTDTSGRIRVSPPHVGIFDKTWRILVQ